MPQSVFLQPGEKFGLLTVIAIASPGPRGESQVECRCDCGAELITTAAPVRRGHKRSCGCLRVTQGIENGRHTVHGHASREGKSPTYLTWRAMLSRCSDPRNRSYPRYGGRGITVRYPDFASFLADVGPRPSGTTIDRINPDGDYEPGNCRWASPKAQRANRSDSRGDMTRQIEDLRSAGVSAEKIARSLGVHRATVYRIIKRARSSSASS